MDESSGRRKKNPIGLRALFWGSNKARLNRRRGALIFEVFILPAAVLMLVAGLSHSDEGKKLPLVLCSLPAVFSAYLRAVPVRPSDKYSLWQTGT